LKKYPEHQIIVPRFCEANGFYTTKERSELMRKIKAQDTKPELKLRKALWNLGFRYRKNVKKLPGTPDIVYTKQRLAIFVDGEFWHGHNWEEKMNSIKSNRGFWIPKIERNMQRDQANNQLLSQNGWYVMRFWEHEIKRDFDGCVNRVISYLQTCSEI
jgi:DNA mismatch endonuclease (patch repair protein)